MFRRNIPWVEKQAFIKESSFRRNVRCWGKTLIIGTKKPEELEAFLEKR
jgi:hypothetical protein